jgi:dolichol-phosphate mannosyltransferase
MATVGTPELSVVVPARDERENIAPLLEQTRRALASAGIAGELIVVDDGSSDGTFAELVRLAGDQEFVRPLRLPEGRGQSAAIAAGIAAARGLWIATLDGDLQNDPADLPGLLEMARQGGFDMVQGVRVNRQDSFTHKAGSRVAGWTRRLLLGDRTEDTGCATRVVTAALARTFPLQFRGMHRFLPLYARRTGARVVETPVSHRPRLAGISKYGLLDRLFVGLVDCFAVRWMLRRYRSPVPAPPGDG